MALGPNLGHCHRIKSFGTELSALGPDPGLIMTGFRALKSDLRALKPNPWLWVRIHGFGEKSMALGPNPRLRDRIESFGSGSRTLGPDTW